MACKMNVGTKSTMNCDCTQKKKMKMSEDRYQEDQDEEDQWKTSKLIAYLSIKCENL